MFVFVLVCVTLPTASLPNSILIAQVGSWWKTQHIAGLEASKCTGSDIVYSIPDLKSLYRLYNQRNIKTWINQLINLQRKLVTFYCQLCSFLLHVLNPAAICVSLEEEGAGETTLQYFLFGLQYPFKPLAINSTYCAFKWVI